MSFYSRYNGYRGFGDTTEELRSAGIAVDNQRIAAVSAAQAADAAVADAVARLAAAKTLSAMLNRMDGAWFRRAMSPDGTDLSRDFKYPPAEQALFEKYGGTFPQSDVTTDLVQAGYRDFDAESPQLEYDKVQVANEIQNISGELPALKSAASKAKDEVSRLTTATEAATKKFKAASSADAKVAVATVEAKAQSVVQDQVDARVLKTLNEVALTKAATKSGVSPLVIAAVAVPVLGAIFWAMTRKKAAVAGYRRRSRK